MLYRYLPDNQFIRALIVFAQRRGVHFALSPIPVWHYRPNRRTIYLWEEDLHSQPLEFIITAFAHEIGHVVDFDLHPENAKVVAYLGIDEVPEYLEINAFVIGFKILKELKIPFPIYRYVQWITEPLRKKVLSLLVNPL